MIFLISLYLVSCFLGFIGKRLLMKSGVFTAETTLTNILDETLINNKALVILLDIMIFTAGILLFLMSLGIWMVSKKREHQDTSTRSLLSFLDDDKK